MKQRIAIITLIIVAIVFSMGFFFTKTDRGTAIVVDTLRKKLPDVVEFEHIQGHLLGKLDIRELKIHLAQANITIGHINMVNHLTLFGIYNEYFKGDNIVIAPVLVAKQPLKKRTPGWLPWRFVAKDISLDHIRVKLSDHKGFALPPLTAQYNQGWFKTTLVVNPENSPIPYLDFLQQRHNRQYHLRVPIKATELTMFYRDDANAFRVIGDIHDQHGGHIQINGDGDNDNQHIAITATKFDIADLLTTYWPSDITFNLNIARSPIQSEITVANLIGTINQKRLTGNAHILIKSDTIPDFTVKLFSDNAKVNICGSKAAQWLVNWSIDIPTLTAFIPQASGKIVAKGDISGPSLTPNIAGNFLINNFKLDSYKIQNCLADFKLDQEGKQLQSLLQLAANDVQIDKWKINTLQLQGDGNTKQHTLSLKATLPDITTHLKLVGSFIDKKWLGQLQQFNLQHERQQWQLSKPSTLSYHNKVLKIAPLCLRAPNSTICADGVYAQQLLRGNLTAQNFDMSFLNIMLPEKQTLQGRVNLRAFLDLTPAYSKITINANSLAGAYHYVSDDQPKAFSYQKASFNAMTDDKKKLHATLDLTFPEGQATTVLSIKNFLLDANLAHKPITGEVRGQINQLRFLETMIPVIKNTTGKILANFKVTGTFADPIVNGTMNLTQGSFKIPKLNLQVNNVAINTDTSGNDFTLKGNLTSGNGNLSINGKGKVDHGNLPMTLQLQGSNVLICNQPEIKIIATPTMTVDLHDKQLKLAGNLAIPEAKLHPHDFGTTETASDDIVFIQASGKQKENSYVKISSDINLTLGSNITLNYKGINGQLLGQMRIEDSPTKATVAYGQLRLQDGNYKIYGKTLKIDNGKLNFTGGPISNPGLEIKASRTLQSTNSHSLLAASEDLRVGVNVNGTLKDPKISLFSEPGGKSPSDILSYLILGIPADSVSGSNSELLLQAASTLGGGEGGKLLGFKEKLKKSLGLSELDIGTQTEINPKTQESFQHTAFVLGKYLSPKFYVNYSLDLFDHTNTFKVKYLLNRFWTIQSVANTNNSGVDILYTVEK